MPGSAVLLEPRPIRFIRRGQVVSESRLSASRTLLDYLREDLGQTGTKEGCAEGDCGACTVQDAWMERIQLWSDGFYRTPKISWDGVNLSGRPFYYFVYGAACAEVAIDTLTGESRVIAVDILHDIGRSINPGIDIGQVEGGFIQGMGWLTSEELVWNAAGKLLSHAPSTYKIPSTGDVPKRFRIELWPEANREDNVYGSKATGEPPLMLALSVFEAIRHAITCVARPEVMQIPLRAPATPESILRAVTAVRPS